jgi:hypothetical protein
MIDALLEAGACRPLTADLTVAAWCDLIITAIAGREDVTCLLADPITADGAFDELMAWCLEGAFLSDTFPMPPRAHSFTNIR